MERDQETSPSKAGKLCISWLAISKITKYKTDRLVKICLVLCHTIRTAGKPVSKDKFFQKCCFCRYV